MEEVMAAIWELQAKMKAKIRAKKEELKAHRNEMKADLRELKADMNTQIGSLASRMNVYQTRTEATREGMKTSHVEMKPKTGVLVSRMDFVQATTTTYQDETMAAIRSSKEMTKAAMNSFRAKLEETLSIG
jgi:cytochrome c556